MARVDGSLARKLDFGAVTTTTFQTSHAGKGTLRLAARGRGVSGPDKYRVLDHRRHQAQIKARRLLDLLDA
jgi:hypothetical protein